MEVKREVKDVAVYLRKSRADKESSIEETLAKHKMELTEMVKSNGWNYTSFEEVAPAEKIDNRPQLVALLTEVQQELYDAVVVIDYDRLSRGDWEDMGRIQRIFRESETLIITPQRIYDLSNEQDETVTDFEGFIAKYEYKQIKKRLKRGKRNSAKQGFWSNGKPPLPYKYNKETKSLDIDEEKRVLYDKILHYFLDKNIGTYEIARRLNAEGFQTINGGTWQTTQVHRMLTNDVHRGFVVYGRKKKLPSGKQVKVPKEEWILTKGSHEVLKTEEQHNEILKRLKKNASFPVASRRGAYVLSGMVRCGKCGRLMQLTFSRTGEFVRKCVKIDPKTRGSCENKGIKVEYIYEAIEAALNDYMERLNLQEGVDTEEQRNRLETEQESLKLQIEKVKKRKMKLQDMYLDDLISKNDLKERQTNEDQKIVTLESELFEVKSNLVSMTGESKEEKMKRLEEFKNNFDPKIETEEGYKEMNQLLKNTVDSIHYTRNGDELGIDVKFQ